MKLKATEYDEGRGMLLEGSRVLAHFDTIETAREAAKAMNSHSELLAACEQALEQLQHCDCSNEVTTSEGDRDEGVVWALQTEEQLRTAIRKAKGNS